MTPQQRLGSFLRSARVRARLTQQEVAAYLEYSTPQFVSNWERGVSMPPIETLPKVARLYRVSATEMQMRYARFLDGVARMKHEAMKAAFQEERC